MKLTFPKKFLWGVAHSAHQVEGNNKNNDWWEWEQQGKTKESSGWACDSWNRYPLDHQLAQDLGCNAFRFSLEWSRIEPEEGKFSDEAIEHYRKVLQDLKKRGMKRVVTLWHWTLPLWLVKKYGGWYKKESIELFSRYCKKTVKELGGEIDILITLNEPRVPLSHGYLLAKHPPGKRNPFYFRKARKNMLDAQNNCYKIVKKIDKNILCCLNEYYSPFYFSNTLNKIGPIKNLVENYFNWKTMDRAVQYQDVIGLDYYRSFEISFSPPFFRDKMKENKKNDWGWGIWPEGIYQTVKQVWHRYKKPIYIFENGLADKKDKYRKEFIREHLWYLAKAINEGVDVRGYFHWSLLDNFEWAEGFWTKFGLCKVDFKTMERKPRKSYYFYQKVIRENGIEE